MYPTLVDSGNVHSTFHRPEHTRKWRRCLWSSRHRSAVGKQVNVDLGLQTEELRSTPQSP